MMAPTQFLKFYAILWFLFVVVIIIYVVVVVVVIVVVDNHLSQISVAHVFIE